MILGIASTIITIFEFAQTRADLIFDRTFTLWFAYITIKLIIIGTYAVAVYICLPVIGGIANAVIAVFDFAQTRTLGTFTLRFAYITIKLIIIGTYAVAVFICLPVIGGITNTVITICDLALTCAGLIFLGVFLLTTYEQRCQQGYDKEIALHTSLRIYAEKFSLNGIKEKRQENHQCYLP
jgi:hypothetical protein